jgi:hypothetical protein
VTTAASSAKEGVFSDSDVSSEDEEDDEDDDDATQSQSFFDPTYFPDAAVSAPPAH